MPDILRWILRHEPTPTAAPDVGAWWRATEPVRRAFERPVDQAIAGGFAADRLGYAFAAGYEAALRALLDGGLRATPAYDRPWPPLHLASFCVTEAKGNHPKAIDARLERLPSREVRLHGEKRWSTLGPVADEFLVTASEGEEGGRKRLRCVRVPAGAPGVRVSTMPATPFVPEVPHATISFSDVVLPADAVLPGDGYTVFVKPFRTVEDIHVHAGTLGYLAAVARRHGFPQTATELLIAVIVALRGVAEIEPSAAEGHIALAGVLAQSRTLLDGFSPYWDRVGDNERVRLHRDRALFDVASGARERRLERAWLALARGENP